MATVLFAYVAVRLVLNNATYCEDPIGTNTCPPRSLSPRNSIRPNRMLEPAPWITPCGWLSTETRMTKRCSVKLSLSAVDDVFWESD